MANRTTTTRIDRTPTHNDLEVALLAHRAMADVQDSGRFGDRKVFIVSLWTRMITIEAETGGALTEGATIEKNLHSVRGDLPSGAVVPTECQNEPADRAAA